MNIKVSDKVRVKSKSIGCGLEYSINYNEAKKEVKIFYML